MKVATCHPEQPLYCKDRCKDCYEKEYYLAHRKTPTPKLYDVSKEKQCANCLKVKLLTEFSHRRTSGKSIPYCKPCMVIKNKEAKKRDPSIYRRIEWPSKIKKAYGITPTDYDTMLNNQKGCCAICGSPSPKSTRTTKFCIDHKHDSSAKVRGLLCNPCNRAVGLISDNPETATKMAEYLNKEY